MATWLNGHGVTSNDLTFFRERRARRRRWIGTRYDPRCERRLASTGRLTLARRGHGLHRLAAALHHRYRVPLCYGASYEGPERAVRWLGSQWDDVLSLRRSGIPVTGFTWHALVDRTAWRGNLAASGDGVHSIGLLDLQRRVRGVGKAFATLAEQWSPRMADRPALPGARGQASA